MTTHKEAIEELIRERIREAGTTVETRIPDEQQVEYEDALKSEEVAPAADGHKKYSEVFGWDDVALAGKKDFDVEMFDHTDGVPDINPHYVINHKVMYPLVLSKQKHIKAKVLLVGPTGSGKTEVQSQYCARVGKGMYRINGRGDMESDTLIGRPWVGTEGMEWIEGELPKALQSGKDILIDEPWKIPSHIWMTLQRLMEKNGVLQVDDMPEGLDAKTIVPHPDARICLADNVLGVGDNIEKYGATMIQDASTLNRIDIVIPVDYMDESDEVEILANQFPILVPKSKDGKLENRKNVENMVRVLNLLRRGFDDGTMHMAASLRTMEAWATWTIQLRDYKEGYELAVVNRYPNDAEKQAARQHFEAVFGE